MVPASSQDWECWEDPRFKGWICFSFPVMPGQGVAQTQLGVGNVLGMGLPPSQRLCHLWEWDVPIPGALSPLGMGCLHPRGCVTFGNGMSLFQGQCHLWPGEHFLKAGWNSGTCCPEWDEWQKWDLGMAVSTLRVTTGLSLPGDMAEGGDRQGTSLGQLPQL